MRETVTAGTKSISHYDAPGEAVAWTSEEEGKKSTRNIPGLDGSLTATQTNNETPVLQLHDLQGDIVATIGDNASETKLRSTYSSTEFGVPNAGKPPPKYAWLGAGGVASELASGVVTYGATSYVPQIGKSLQAAEVIPPGLPDGAGGGAPVTFQEEPWVMLGAANEADEAPGLEAGRAREAAEAACRASLAACPVQEEDPDWIWTLTIEQSDDLASAIYGGEGYLTVSNVGGLIKATLGIDYFVQAEELVEKTLLGFSRGEVEGWALNLAGKLNECGGLAYFGYEKPKSAHCWVYVPTTKRRYGFETPFGFVGVVLELPEFSDDPTVAYCPHGTENCGAALGGTPP